MLGAHHPSPSIMPLLIRLASLAFNWARLFGKPKHRKNVRAARALLAKLKGFQSEGAIIAYLRKINPLVFEELILCLFERDGLFVARSPSYSGDGGVDGSFYWPGKGRCAIQSKRYSKAITPAHARDFARVVARSYKAGVFAHTGRTGELSLEALGVEGLGILSGQGLARAIQGARVLPLIEARAHRLRSRPPAKPAPPKAQAGSKRPPQP